MVSGMVLKCQFLSLGEVLILPIRLSYPVYESSFNVITKIINNKSYNFVASQLVIGIRFHKIDFAAKQLRIVTVCMLKNNENS